MHRIADIETGKLEDKLRRNIIGRAKHFDFVTHDVENTARFEAGAFVFAFEDNRHVSTDFPLGIETQEIDMHRGIRYRMELHITWQHAVFGAIDFDVYELDKELRIVELFDEYATFQRQ